MRLVAIAVAALVIPAVLHAQPRPSQLRGAAGVGVFVEDPEHLAVSATASTSAPEAGAWRASTCTCARTSATRTAGRSSTWSRT